MGQPNGEANQELHRVVVVHKDGTRTVRACNVSLGTAEAIRTAASQLGHVIIERQEGLDLPD